MNESYLHGYNTGLEDLQTGRWDIDNVIVPVQFTNQSRSWYDGYENSFKG